MQVIITINVSKPRINVGYDTTVAQGSDILSVSEIIITLVGSNGMHDCVVFGLLGHVISPLEVLLLIVIPQACDLLMIVLVPVIKGMMTKQVHLDSQGGSYVIPSEVHTSWHGPTHGSS